MLIVACTKGATTPEGLIRTFVNDVSTKKMDIDYFEKFTTGELLESIQTVGVENYENDTRMKSVTGAEVEILSKNCESSTCIVTYIVKFNTKNPDEGKFKSEIKKIAEVKREGDFWKLSKVTNLKTFHESYKAINPLDDQVPENTEQ